MGKLAILMDVGGRQITNPGAIEADVSWSAKDGLAQAFNASGKCIAELHGARIEWIQAGGVRLVGMEPTNASATVFRAQQWQYKPETS